MHALIIEDEPLVACMIEDILRANGAKTVDFADRFGTAIVAAGLRPPDLITADVDLAEGSGIDAVEMIGAVMPTRVIFITGQVDAVLARLPDATVLPKPFSAPALERMVVRLRG